MKEVQKVQIKKITLSNWKGQNRSVEFTDTNKIIGRNASGKTTIMKAWMWLLTGYSDAFTKQNSDLFDNTKEITKDTPTASVKAEITISGLEYVIERTAKAKFVRKRGTDDYEKHPSDEYKFYVDEVEYTSTMFEQWLNDNIVSSDYLKYAMSGDFFINLVFDKKDKARQLIESLFGQFDDKLIEGDYSILEPYIKTKGMTLSQVEEMAKSKIKGINETIERIPVEINSKETLLASLKDIDTKTIQKTIAELEKRQKDINKQLFDISERQKPILEAIHNAKMEKIARQDIYDRAKVEYERNYIDKDTELVRMISNAESENSKRAELLNKLTNDKTKLYAQQVFLNNKLDDLRKQRDSIKATTEETCPMCGSVITDKDTLVKLQSDRLKQIVFDGNIALNEVAHNAELILDIETLLNNVPNEIDVEPLREKLKELRRQDIVPFEETEQGLKLQKDIDSVVIPQNDMVDTSVLLKEDDEISTELKKLYLSLPDESKIKQLEEDIQNLQTRQREIGIELATFEKIRQRVKDYNQEKMDIMSKSINDKFTFSRLDIWSTQKDGQIIPDLVIKNADGVSYATANNASRILVSVDIQQMFCERFGINLPIWIDEATILDSFHLPKVKGTQMFYILCSDDELTIKNK